NNRCTWAARVPAPPWPPMRTALPEAAPCLLTWSPATPPWHDDVVTLSADFSATPDRQHGAEIQRLCDAMEAAGQAGRYPQLTVERPWSVHNPVLEGEFACPEAIRWC